MNSEKGLNKGLIMSLPDPKIGWERWLDIYSSDDLNKLNYPSKDEEEEVSFLNDGGNMDLEDEELEDPVLNTRPIKTIVTKLCAIPIYEHSRPGKVFKFWIGHANFSISSPIQEIIDKTIGVESLEIFSPYRFRISVGKMFKSYDVKKSIEDRTTYFVKNRREMVKNRRSRNKGATDDKEK